MKSESLSEVVILDIFCISPMVIILELGIPGGLINFSVGGVSKGYFPYLIL